MKLSNWRTVICALPASAANSVRVAAARSSRLESRPSATAATAIAHAKLFVPLNSS
ncbi:MAG: hypothetical protein M5R40_12990 [Anaerolineae bacterium]|nr:hypothetical protein [Anaerolineae bacterium]